ncbi:anti-sigma regulatory factor [Peribacillus alkalitolerans]|uniref:anti-sigma regulatory factor n=1 Tax=Peribacillus alkalitolerans TaxID=1550385 RepID=UPI0013D88D17|nr:anti-sigma regulatory factor [Peribacillus alkalitolerans]
MSNRVVVNINNEWDIVLARQKGREEAKRLNFSVVDQARITTAISELARNIYLYALPGKIIIEELIEHSKHGLKIHAIDEGPGISDVRKVLEDGYSTSGGLGAGVPGAKRLFDVFSIESKVGVGTEIIGIKWKK